MYAFVQGQSADSADQGVNRSIHDSVLHSILVYGWHNYDGNPIHRLPVGAKVYAYSQEEGYYGVCTVLTKPETLRTYEDFNELEGEYGDGGDLYVRVQWHRRRQFNPIPYAKIGYAPRNVNRIQDLGKLRALEQAFGTA